MATTEKRGKAKETRPKKARPGKTEKTVPAPASKASPEFAALVDSLCGSMAESMFTVDDYLEAKHAGVDAENAAMKRLAAARRRAAKTRRPAKPGERRKLVDSIMGKYAWVPYSSEDFNRDKRKEIALENRV